MRNIRLDHTEDRRKGFTLVETLVAISILLVAVVVPLVLLSQSISSARQTQDQVTALYMAQDAVEYLKYIVATNANDPTKDWLTNLDGSGGTSDCLEPKTCTIDSFTNTINQYTGQAPVLRYDSSSGSYGYKPTATPTKFTRTILLKKISPPQIPGIVYSQLLVTVTVSWETSTGASKSVSLGHTIFNYRGKIE